LTQVEFVVEQAGCASCAGRVRTALEALATVEAIDVDEEADAATVRVRPLDRISEQAVVEVLRKASAGSAHEYRVRPGSWRATSA
jgi:copper chaperone CopZ